MPYRNRTRRKTFPQKVRIYLRRVLSNIRKFFKKLFKKRQPGEPIYKDRRLIAALAAVVVTAAVVIPVAVFVPRARNAENADAVPASAQAEELPAPEPTPEPIMLKLGSTGEKVYELGQRLTELGYIEADSLVDEPGTDEPDEDDLTEEDEDAPEGTDAESTADQETSAEPEPTPFPDEPEEMPITDEEKAAFEFTENLETAVKRFQILSGAEPDGIVNDALWERLFAADAPVFALAVKMEGDDVKEFQTRLRDLSYLDSDPTGYYGTDTEDAVKLFQEKNSLAVTGNIDMDTQEMLYAENVVANYISYGQRSDDVADMQTKLIKLGYLSGEADGVYGDRTLAAVKLFQKKNDLVVDGYLGYQSKKVLMSDDAQYNAFSIGDEGVEVQRLQERLVQLKYISKATGYFGSDTDAAVKNFQKLNDLTVDGKAGPKTLKKLYSNDVVKAKTTVKVGQSSKVNKFIDAAYSKLGHKYVGGGKGPNVFDCSGLVYWCLKQAGVSQSYVTSVTWRKVGNYKTIKSIDDVRKGDIICYSPHHVGIAISSSTMIDASSRNGKVVKRSFQTSYWRRAFVCARRVF